MSDKGLTFADFVGANTYEGILDYITRRYECPPPDDPGIDPKSLDYMVDCVTRQPEIAQEVRLVGLIFGHPANDAVKAIQPRIAWFHERSRRHVDFFCIGFYREGDQRA